MEGIDLFTEGKQPWLKRAIVTFHPSAFTAGGRTQTHWHPLWNH